MRFRGGADKAANKFEVTKDLSDFGLGAVKVRQYNWNEHPSETQCCTTGGGGADQKKKQSDLLKKIK